MNATIEERVAKGASLLDRVEPDWFTRVDTDVLVMSSCGTCVLGHVYGHYAVGRDKLFPRELYSDWTTLSELTFSHGFNTFESGEEEDSEYNMDEFALLDVAWIDEIEKRLGGVR